MMEIVLIAVSAIAAVVCAISFIAILADGEGYGFFLISTAVLVFSIPAAIHLDEDKNVATVEATVEVSTNKPIHSDTEPPSLEEEPEPEPEPKPEPEPPQPKVEKKQTADLYTKLYNSCMKSSEHMMEEDNIVSLSSTCHNNAIEAISITQ